MDLRELAFASMQYSPAEREKAYNSLPSIQEYSEKNKAAPRLGKSRGMRKATPQEKAISEKTRKKIEEKKKKQAEKAGK